MEIEQSPKRDDYAASQAIAHDVVEDWIKRQHIPTIQEFAPYTGRIITNLMAGIAFRQVYVKNLSWTILTRELVQDFVYVCRKLGVNTLVDAGCGHGVLAHVLREKGLSVVAINASKDGYHEKQRPWGEVIKGDAVEFVRENAHTFDGVILSWPPYKESFGANVVKAMRSGQILFYCGEGSGGCTGDKYLYGALGDWYDWSDKPAPPPPVEFEPLKEESKRLNSHLLQFDGIHDHWMIYIKK